VLSAYQQIEQTTFYFARYTKLQQQQQITLLTHALKFTSFFFKLITHLKSIHSVYPAEQQQQQQQ
jgi:hypothetical protein